MHCTTAALLALLLTPAAVPTPAPTVAEAVVVLEWADGRRERQPLAEFSLDGADDPRLLGFTLDGLAPRAADGEATSGGAERARFELVGGDRLTAEVRGGSEEQLQLALAGGVVLTLGIDELASLVYPARLSDSPDAAPRPSEEGDRLYRRAGGVLDRLDGAVLGFDAEGVSFESLLGASTVPWSEVAALYLESFGAATEKPVEGLAVALDLVDGSRLRGGLLGLDSAGCRLARPGGAELVLPLAALAEVTFADGRFAFLSDLEPANVVEGSPFGDDLGLSWPHRVDRAVDGGPLRVEGRTYMRGLGAHAPSRITWALDDQYDTLHLAVALDDQVLRLDARGSVEFRVLLDDELAWTSGVRRGGDPVLEMPALALGEARRLTLEIDMATDFHMGDRANWLRPRLVRAGTQQNE